MAHADRERTITIRRSELICPAHSLKMMAKAAASDADEVIFDLEDGCAPSQKIAARKTLVEALRTLDFGGKIRAFRVNGIDTKFFLQDFLDVLKGAGDTIDVLVAPKIESAGDVQFVDRLLSALERDLGWTVGRIKLEVLIENARAVLHAEEIAAAAPRLVALVFGVVDYAGNIGAREPVREQFALYHYPKAKTVAAARGAGIDVVDSVTLQLRDLDLCEHDARKAAQMGFDGKWAIHPDQVEIINRAFTPSREELVRAREIVEAYDKSDVESGAGVFIYKDEMVDAASLPIERKKLAIAKRCGLVE
jgi:citrate lyase subunit beta/citryl-CoA lyase